MTVVHLSPVIAPLWVWVVVLVAYLVTLRRTV